MPTTTSLTLARLRRCGYEATTCEVWIPRIERRRDLFGIADVIGCHPTRQEVLLIQCTSLAHVTDRLQRVKGRPELRTWLQSGGRFAVWGWFQRAGRWDVKIVSVEADELRETMITAPPRRHRRPRQAGLFDALETVA